MRFFSKYSLRGTLVISMATVCFLLNGCTSHEPQVKKAQVVSAQNNVIETAQVKIGKISENIVGNGILVPSNTTSISYGDLSGTLKKIMIKQNDKITAGQPLIEIIPTDSLKKIADLENSMKRWSVRLLQLKENIYASKNSMKLSKLNLDIAKKLSDTKRVTDSAVTLQQLILQNNVQSSAYTSAILNLKIAQIDYDNDRKNLKELKKKVGQSILKSTVNGIAVFVESLSGNDPVYPGLIITRIAETKNLVFKMSTIEASYIRGVTKGKLNINGINYDTSYYVPRPGDQLEQEVNNQLTKNYVYLSFSNNVPVMKLNMLVSTNLQIAKNNVLIIPESATFEDNGKTFVDVLSGSATKTVQIVRGLANSNDVEVISGLTEGDKVVIR